MAKKNPNRAELLDFINDATSELNIKSTKIEDLSNGVQYLHLLHQTHPQIVKMSKVNLKANLQHECLTNIRLLATYLAEIKAPFPCEVQKISQRNYQQNLNLLKNLYWLHNKSKDSNFRESSASFDAKLEGEKKKPKIVIKPPEKPVVKAPSKKETFERGPLDDTFTQAKKNAEMIKSIMIVIKGEKPVLSEEESAAKQKVDKIAKILGINRSQRKSQKPQMINEPKNQQVEEKKPEHKEEQKKSKKSFSIDEIKRSVMLQAQQRKQAQQKKEKQVRESRMSTRNFFQTDEEDEEEGGFRFSDLLSSPVAEVKEVRETRRSGSKAKKETKESIVNPHEQKEQKEQIKQNGQRKSALIKRPVSLEGASQERNQTRSLKKVRWEGEKSSDKKKVSSEKKQLSSVKENEEVSRPSSAMKRSDRVLRSSGKDEEIQD